MRKERRSPVPDRALEAAEEEAEGVGGYRPPPERALLEWEREEAEGIELFDDPDATIPVDDLRDGAPDRESLVVDPEHHEPERDDEKP